VALGSKYLLRTNTQKQIISFGPILKKGPSTLSITAFSLTSNSPMTFSIAINIAKLG
jgi:hypothetical protein